MRGAERSRNPATGTLGPVLAAWCSHPSQTSTIQCQESLRGSFSPSARAVTTGCPGAELTSGSHRLQVPRLESQTPGSSIRPVARRGDRALGSCSELGPVFALGGASSFISYKRRMRKKGVSGCLYVGDRDRGQGRRPISLSSSLLLGLSSSQTLQAASPPCCPQAGTKGWGGTGPPLRLHVPDLPLSLSLHPRPSPLRPTGRKQNVPAATTWPLLFPRVLFLSPEGRPRVHRDGPSQGKTRKYSNECSLRPWPKKVQPEGRMCG